MTILLPKAVALSPVLGSALADGIIGLFMIQITNYRQDLSCTKYRHASLNRDWLTDPTDRSYSFDNIQEGAALASRCNDVKEFNFTVKKYPPSKKGQRSTKSEKFYECD